MRPGDRGKGFGSLFSDVKVEVLEDTDIVMGENCKTGLREDVRGGNRGFLVGVYSRKEYLRLPYVEIFLNRPCLSRSSHGLARRSLGESHGLKAETSESFLSGVLGSSVSSLGFGPVGDWKLFELNRGTQMSLALPGLMTVA